jgi:HK97 family phage portal protein
VGLWGGITNLLGFSASSPAPDDDFWYEDDPQREGGRTARVDADSALSIAAVYSCVKFIAESLSTLPCEFYRWVGQKDKELAERHPLYQILRFTPNSWQTPVEFFETMIGHCALGGEAFAEKIPGARGSVDALEPLHPRRVCPYWIREGSRRFINFEVWDSEEDGKKQGVRILTQDEVFRFCLMSRDGLRGCSPIEEARRAFDLANQMQEHGARLYENDATPGGILKTPNALKPEAREQLRKSWERMHRGPKNKRKVAIMDNGLSWESVGMTMQDAEWIASRKFSRSEIAGIFRVPPHKIGDLERSTHSNIEEQNIESVTDCIRPWAVRIEQAIVRDLVSQPGTYFAEFNFEQILRGDSERQAKANEIKFRNGALTHNEWRAKDGENRYESGGDRRYIMVNMVPVDRIDDMIDNKTPPGDGRPGSADSAGEDDQPRNDSGPLDDPQENPE